MATRRPRKPSKASIKAKADRAEKTARGEDVTPEPTVMEPPETKVDLRGRPTLYTPEIGDTICAALATGMSLRSVCRSDDLPAESTVRDWASNIKHPFSAQYVRARELGYLAMADETLEISDDGSNDWMEKFKDGEVIGYIENGEAIARSRLRVDTRKWLLSKCLPKIYGDKVTTELTGAGGGPVEIVTTDKLALARWIAMQLASAVMDPVPAKQIDVAGRHTPEA